MITWSNSELDKIAAADELQIRSVKLDGALSNPVTIWVVRHGDDLYIRSVNGRDSGWFRGTQNRHEGRISAGGVEKDVSFVDSDPGINDAIDEAYHTKYRRYAANIVATTVTPKARATTTKLVPR